MHRVVHIYQRKIELKTLVVVHSVKTFIPTHRSQWLAITPQRHGLRSKDQPIIE